jgi:DNA polymerase-3 subunit beta
MPDATPDISLAFPAADLRKVLPLLAKFVAKRPTLPVLGYILVEKHPMHTGVARLTATNLEAGASLDINADFSGTAESIVLDSKALLAIAKSADKTDWISVVSVSDGMRAKVGNFTSMIPYLPGDEFPVMQRDDLTPLAGIHITALKGAIAQTAFCAATDEARPILTGVHINGNAQRLLVEAADNYRLSRAIVESFTLSRDAFDLVIPARPLSLWAKVCTDDGYVLVSQSKNRAMIRLESTDLDVWIRNIDGQFPNVDAVMPISFAYEARVWRPDLLAAAKIVELASRKEAHVAKLFINGSAVLTDGAGKTSVQLPSTSLIDANADITIALNAGYLVDALAAIPDNLISLKLQGPMAPMRIDSAHGPTQIVMPVRTV